MIIGKVCDLVELIGVGARFGAGSCWGSLRCDRWLRPGNVTRGDVGRLGALCRGREGVRLPSRDGTRTSLTPL